MSFKSASVLLSVDRYQDTTNLSRLKHKHVFDQAQHKQTVNPTEKIKQKNLE